MLYKYANYSELYYIVPDYVRFYCTMLLYFAILYFTILHYVTLNYVLFYSVLFITYYIVYFTI